MLKRRPRSLGAILGSTPGSLLRSTRSSHFSSLDHPYRASGATISDSVDTHADTSGADSDDTGGGARHTAGHGRIADDYVALIIAYRDHDLVAGVLDRLTAQTVQPGLVLVVDNGGTIEPEDLEGWPLADRSRLVSRPDNPGYGAAVNEAKDHLDGRALLVLTHDAVFGPDLAEQLLSALSGRGDAGAAAPILRFVSDPDRVFSAGGRLSPSGLASHLPRALSAEPYPVDWVDGAIVMLDPQAFEAVEGIAEEYFLYFEDVDTGWRLARAGLRSLVVPTAIAHQQPGAHPTYLGMRNMALFSRKAGISAPKSLGAAAARAIRAGLGNLRRGRSPELIRAWRGWRDGRAGLSGPPAH